MPDFVSDEVVRLPLSAITVLRDVRQREIFTTDDLEASIKLYGVLQPIVVWKNEAGENILIMGERRFTASQNLNLPSIPARFAKHQLSLPEREILEFEENVKRQDLSWPEHIKAIYSIHSHYREANPDWTQEQTAAAMGFESSVIYRAITVHKAILAGDEQLLDCPSYKNAYAILQGKQERAREAAAAMLDEEISETFSAPTSFTTPAPGVTVSDLSSEPLPEGTVEPTTSPSPPAYEVKPALGTPLALADFFEFATQYSGPPFNFLHCDFPYGTNIQNSDQIGGLSAGTYEDSPDLYWSLLKACFEDNLDRLVSSSAHIIFWHAWKWHKETRIWFEDFCPDLEVQDVPLIWHKSDNKGVMADATRRPRNTTEVALFISRGDRKLVAGKATSNSYAAPTSKVIHQSEKPIPVLKHFFQMIVDEHTRMLDPTAGSGNALVAADSFGAAQLLGLERDPEYHERSVIAWRKYAKLKELSGD